MRVGIVGAQGFLGRNLAGYFESKGVDTTHIWRTNEPAASKKLNIVSFLEGGPREFDLVINCAIDYGRNSVLGAISSNLTMPLTLLDLCSSKGIALINIGSFFQKFPIASYSPLKSYSFSKSLFCIALEEYMSSDENSAEHRMVNMYLEHVYGPGDGAEKFVASILRQMTSGAEGIPLTHGMQTRDFIFIDDAVEMIYRSVPLLLSNQLKGKAIEVGTGAATSIRDFVLTASDVTGFEGNLDWGRLDPPPGEVENSAANGLLAELLGISHFVPPREGLSRTVRDSI
jgi:nucleoside-diphosphate-sugar epimerase